MSETINNDVIKKTQITLGKYVKKPPLSVKLLSKPPFRFLYDVLMTVVRGTGFLKGLYSIEEQNSENIKEREHKIAFLQKTVDVVKLVTGIPLTVRPAKIISGHEPEKTNELLQAIGYAIENNLSSTDAVHQVLNKTTKKEGNTTDRRSTNVKQPKSQQAKLSSKVAPKAEIPKEKKSINDRSSSKPRTEVKSRDKKTESVKKESVKSTATKEGNTNRRLSKADAEPVEIKAEVISPKLDRQKTEVIESGVKTKHIDLTDNENSESIFEKPKSRKQSLESSESAFEKPKSRKSSLVDKSLERQRSRSDSLKPTVNDTADEENNTKEDLQSSNEGQHVELAPTIMRHDSGAELRLVGDSMRLNTKTPIQVNDKTEETKEKSVQGLNLAVSNEADTLKPMRPPSVRPRTSLRPPSVRPVSARPGAPRIRDRHADIVIEPDEVTSMGKVNVTLEVFDGAAMNPSLDEDDAEDLVVIETRDSKQEIADAKTAEELANQEDAGESGRGRLVGQILSTQRALGDAPKAPVKLERETVNTSSSDSSALDALRSSVQELSSAALPLGRLLDFLQEDADAMRRELKQWREACAQTSEALRKDNGLTEEIIQPLRQQLQQLVDQIAEQREMINTSKANILRQEEKIVKLLSEC